MMMIFHIIRLKQRCYEWAFPEAAFTGACRRHRSATNNDLGNKQNCETVL